jgi:hypothetical protein
MKSKQLRRKPNLMHLAGESYATVLPLWELPERWV